MRQALPFGGDGDGGDGGGDGGDASRANGGGFTEVSVKCETDAGERAAKAAKFAPALTTRTRALPGKPISPAQVSGLARLGSDDSARSRVLLPRGGAAAAAAAGGGAGAGDGDRAEGGGGGGGAGDGEGEGSGVKEEGVGTAAGVEGGSGKAAGGGRRPRGGNCDAPNFQCTIDGCGNTCNTL